jgi:hypothetical protein
VAGADCHLQDLAKRRLRSLTQLNAAASAENGGRKEQALDEIIAAGKGPAE